MSKAVSTRLMAGVLAVLLAACGDSADLPPHATFGPDPTLPEPSESLIPTVDIAPAKGWPGSISM